MGEQVCTVVRRVVQKYREKGVFKVLVRMTHKLYSAGVHDFLVEDFLW
jgi:hypothetical protein